MCSRFYLIFLFFLEYVLSTFLNSEFLTLVKKLKSWDCVYLGQLCKSCSTLAFLAVTWHKSVSYNVAWQRITFWQHWPDDAFLCRSIRKWWLWGTEHYNLSIEPRRKGRPAGGVGRRYGPHRCARQQWAEMKRLYFIMNPMCRCRDTLVRDSVWNRHMYSSAKEWQY